MSGMFYWLAEHIFCSDYVPLYNSYDMQYKSKALTYLYRKAEEDTVEINQNFVRKKWKHDKMINQLNEQKIKT